MMIMMMITMMIMTPYNRQSHSFLLTPDPMQDTPGNLSGDGFQLGGTFIIEKGGRVLLEHRQQYYGHEVALNTVRSTLGLPTREADDE